MADFICKIGTERGEIVEKRFTAESEKTLKLDLEQRGYYIFFVKPAGLSFFGKNGERKIKLDSFIIFNQEFKALLKAGLPATRSLDILIGRQKQESALGGMLKEVRDSIETGSSISEAFAIHRHRLPIAYVSTLVAGERSGDLADAIERYVSYAKLTNSLRKNFKKAIYYPIFLIGLSAILIALMLMYVLPEFSKFYEGFEEELPGFTVFVLGIAEVMKNYWFIIFGAIAAAVILLRWWKKTESGSRTWAKILFGFPLFGDLLHKYQLSQIFHSLAVMLKGGMPLLTCLTDLGNSMSNPVLGDAIQVTKQRVSEGESLTSAVANTAICTDLSEEMIQVGESTGSLPEMLSNLATFYDEEVQNKTQALLSLVEPTLLLLMAIIVGSLLFSMYYPLFNLMGNLGANY